MTQQEQEKQAIEKASNKCVEDYYSNIGGYYEDHILTNGDKMRLMFRFGAEFALSKLHKQEFYCGVDLADPNSRDMTGEFNLSEFRKPSELVDVDLLISDEDSVFKRMSNYLDQLLRKQKEAGKQFISDSQIDELCSKAFSFEKERPSEPVGRTNEELVLKIANILNNFILSDDNPTYWEHVTSCSAEIAKLLPPRRQENDVNMELLEAAKYFHEAWICEYSKITALRSDVDKHSNAITNAEKQMK